MFANDIQTKLSKLNETWAYKLMQVFTNALQVKSFLNDMGSSMDEAFELITNVNAEKGSNNYTKRNLLIEKIEGVKFKLDNLERINNNVFQEIENSKQELAAYTDVGDKKEINKIASLVEKIDAEISPRLNSNFELLHFLKTALDEYLTAVGYNTMKNKSVENAIHKIIKQKEEDLNAKIKTAEQQYKNANVDVKKMADDIENKTMSKIFTLDSRLSVVESGLRQLQSGKQNTPVGKSEQNEDVIKDIEKIKMDIRDLNLRVSQITKFLDEV